MGQGFSFLNRHRSIGLICFVLLFIIKHRARVRAEPVELCLKIRPQISAHSLGPLFGAEPDISGILEKGIILWGTWILGIEPVLL